MTAGQRGWYALRRAAHALRRAAHALRPASLAATARRLRSIRRADLLRALHTAVRVGPRLMLDLGRRLAGAGRGSKWGSRLRRCVIGLVVVALAATVAAFGYAMTVPLPDDPQEPQASVLYFRDGKTVLARLGVTNRTDVDLGDIPQPMRHAVLVAEDRGFYEHDGVSLRGVGRAVFANLKGDAQGASTITQQYARNAYLSQERTASRKAQELVLAVKIENKYSKNEILCKYLNTIYFGRGAYGIAAASQAYFGIAPNQLSVAQSALLASVIRSPWGFDPAVDEKAARARWRWIIDSMKGAGYLDAATASAATFPATLPAGASLDSLRGPNGHIADVVERELAGHGVSPQVLHTAGLRVVTTVDQRAQQAAIDRMKTVSNYGADLRSALVAVDPATGGIRAYYGGREGHGFFDDAAAPRPPASTFKPVTLAAGLVEGVSYLSQWDGSSPRTFPGRVLYNQNDLQCPYCTLEQAMVQSLNTPFYALGEKVGVTRIRELALQMGIAPSYDEVPALVDVKGDPLPGKTRGDISIGRYAVSPADLATVYATFAAGGNRTERHIVQLVTGGGGSAAASQRDRKTRGDLPESGTEIWYSAQPTSQRVLEPGVAADVTAVLHQVAAEHGQPDGHQAATKTGTQQWGNTSDNQDAWMAGYTQSLATVVWVGTATPGPIRDPAGTPIAGDGLPAQLWREFMTDALVKTQPVALPEPAHVGRTDAGDAQAQAQARAAAAQAAAQARLMSNRTRSGGRTVALTFDDGPASGATGQILEVLAQYDVKATFCMIGEQVPNNAEAVRRVVAEGHHLCGHTMHHQLPATTDQIKKDLIETRSTLVNTAPGARVDYFRAPGGHWGASPDAAAALGMTPVTWTVDPADWNRPGVDAIVQAVQEQLKPGGIVLLHDGGGDRAQTVAALKILIPALLEEGWTFDFPATTVTPVTVNPTPTPNPATSTPAVPSPSSDPSPSASTGTGTPSDAPDDIDPSAKTSTD